MRGETAGSAIEIWELLGRHFSIKHGARINVAYRLVADIRLRLLCCT